MIVARVNTQPFAGTADDLLAHVRQIADREVGQNWPASNREARKVARKLAPLIEVEQGEVGVKAVRDAYTQGYLQALDDDDTEAAQAAAELL